ncbi:MAG: hypothetical protein WC619_01020 [Patescibacteria group bacterium]
MRNLLAALAIIFFLLPIAGKVAAEEDIVIIASGCELNEVDKKIIKSTIRTDNRGLPVKEVIILVDSYDFKRSDGSPEKRNFTTVTVNGEASSDSFEGKDLFSGTAKSVSSIKRALKFALQKRNEKQAAGNKAGDKAVNSTGSDAQMKPDQTKNQGQEKSDLVTAPKVEKSKAKFKIIKKQ